MNVTQKRMAHALSIVAEAGLGGFEYKAAVNAIRADYTYRSVRCRWTIAESPSFTVAEFREFMSYAAIAGFVDAGSNTDKLARGEYGIKSWHIRLTLEGWRQIELHDEPVLTIWVKNVRDNFPTLIVSIIVALCSSWALFTWGPPAP